MKNKVIVSILGFSTLLFVKCTDSTESKELASISGENDSLSKVPFPDFGFMLPPDSVHENVFKLSQNYPIEKPVVKEKPAFFDIDFTKGDNWKKYMLEVRNYCFEGNTEVDFRVENNKKRDWYHMPWQHYGPSGREGFHGLTKEAPVKPYQLAQTQDYGNAVAWAVGFYNDLGGYTIGQVWKDHSNPNPKASVFEEGTVVFKLLFVSIPENIVEQQVPSLINPIKWDAYGTSSMGSQNRVKMKMTLIQMDMMVKDERAPQGWVLGTFQYNGAMNKKNKWENLIPVGLMWGEDPDNNTNFSNPQPKETIINPLLTQTRINPDKNELPATHLGWNSRLNGPVDNPQSSCYSCHGTAEYPQQSPISPLFYPPSHPTVTPGSKEWMRWFQNIQCGEPFDKTATSTDFSLQMSAALANFFAWRDEQSGLFANQYKTNGKQMLRNTKKMVYPVRRNH